MLRILVIEDEPLKKQAITKAICETPSISLDQIQSADNAKDAKRLIRQYRFDLVVLDPNIPENSASKAEVGAGLDVLGFIRNNKKANPPGYVLGLTAYDEAFATAVDAFESALWKLMRFSHSDTAWKRALKSALEYLLRCQLPPYVTDGRTHHCDFGIAVALEEELNGVLALPYSWKKLEIPNDHAQYHSGVNVVNGIPRSVVATVASRMGLTNMAISVTRLIDSFHPRIVASLGMCAGVRQKTKIGDILVADPCFDWGSGKWIRETKTRLKFQPAQYQWRLDARLAACVREIAGDTEFLNAIHRDFGGKKPAKPPRVLLDAMASGASVLQVEEMMRDVREQHKNLIGVEMENYAVFAASEVASEPRPFCITAKSVCDYGDEGKKEGYRRYATHTSSAFFSRLLNHPTTLELLGD